MLYVSTRSRTDSYTAHRALHEPHAPDGGMFVPLQIPQVSDEEILLLSKSSFCENVANILNLFFSVRLTGKDLEFYIGRYPAKIQVLSRKLLVAEAWHNLSASYTHLEQAIYRRLCGEKVVADVPEWVKIAINIAFLFAVYGQTEAAQTAECIDIAVDDSAFIAPMAAWYARKMGLPIGHIICGGQDDGSVWDLTRRGELDTATDSEAAANLERYIYVTFGQDEAMRYVDAFGRQEIYYAEEEMLGQISHDFFAAVVSKNRIRSVISNFYGSNHYILDVNAAVGYGALQDYRSSTGEHRQTLVLSLNSPLKTAKMHEQILDLTATQIEQIMNHRKG